MKKMLVNDDNDGVMLRDCMIFTALMMMMMIALPLLAKSFGLTKY